MLCFFKSWRLLLEQLGTDQSYPSVDLHYPWVCFLDAFSQFFHFSLCLSTGVEAWGLPGGQERPDQPNGCSNGQFVWVCSGHIQHRYRPVRRRCPQQQLLLWTEQEHLWSGTYVVTKQKKTKTTIRANWSEWSNMLCVCLSSCSHWRVRYSRWRSVWSDCAATSRQPLQALRSGHHHSEHRLLLWQHQHDGTGQH